MPLIGKAYRNTVIAPRPQFLNQPVLLLFTPFPLQEVDNLRSAVNKFAAVTPFALDGIGQRDLSGIAAVPAIFSGTDFLCGALAGERRQRRTLFGHQESPV